MRSSEHKLKKTPREIHDTICDQPDCEFFGKDAQQGVCYSDKPDLVDWQRIEHHEQKEIEELAYFRKKYRGKKYVEWLEAMYLCGMINWDLTLDELIRLRRDNALLKLQLSRKAKPSRLKFWRGKR